MDVPPLPRYRDEEITPLPPKDPDKPLLLAKVGRDNWSPTQEDLQQVADMLNKVFGEKYQILVINAGMELVAENWHLEARQLPVTSVEELKASLEEEV